MSTICLFVSISSLVGLVILRSNAIAYSDSSLLSNEKKNGQLQYPIRDSIFIYFDLFVQLFHLFFVLILFFYLFWTGHGDLYLLFLRIAALFSL